MNKSDWSSPLEMEEEEEEIWPTVRKTLAELNVRHSTFGICLQEDLDVGRGDVSLLVFIPAHPRPAVAFVFFYDVQQLTLRHGDGAFIMAWRQNSNISTAQKKHCIKWVYFVEIPNNFLQNSYKTGASGAFRGCVMMSQRALIPQHQQETDDLLLFCRRLQTEDK